MKCHVNDDKLGTRTICVSTDLAPAAYTGSIHALCSVSVYMCMRMLLDFSGWVDVLATQERREIKLWLTAVVRDIGEDPTLLSVALLSRNINNYWRPNAHQAYVCVHVCECVHPFLWFIVLTFFSPVNFSTVASTKLYICTFLSQFLFHYPPTILFGGLMVQ